jgi:hypothetical protein
MKEGSVFNFLTLLVEHHQAGVVPFLNGILCNQCRWKIIIKFFDMHEMRVKAPGNRSTTSSATRDLGKLDYKAFIYSKALLVLSRVLGFFATGAADSMQVVKVLFF